MGRELRRGRPRSRRRRGGRLPDPGRLGVRHYRPRSALPRDLGKVVRYVGLDLLFASSPLYPPYFTADRVPGRVDLDVNTVEGWSGVNASEAYIKRGLFRQELAELPAGYAIDLPSRVSRRHGLR